MKKYLLASCMTTLNCFAQLSQGSFTIGGAGNDVAISIVQTTDGGYATAGYTNSYGAGGNDFYVVKMDKGGALQWAKTIGGTGDEQGRSIVQTTDGGYAVVGWTPSYGAGGIDVYVVKLGPSGVLQWTKTIGGQGTDYGFSIVQTTDGGYAIAGATTSYGAGIMDMYVVKLDPAGVLQWTKTIGGTGDDVGNSIVQTTDGGYAVTGYTNSYGAGGYDVYIVKLNSVGGLQWTKTIGGAGNESGTSIVQTADGGYAVAGSTDSYGAGGEDVYAVKLDPAGGLQWTKTIGGTNLDAGYSIIQTTDGGYAMAGRTFSYGAGSNDFYVLKLDTAGTIAWTRTIGGTGTDWSFSIVQTADGGYAVAGLTASYGAGGTDVYVQKLGAGGGICVATGSGGTTGSGGSTSSGGAINSGGTTNSGGITGSGGTLDTLCITTSFLVTVVPVNVSCNGGCTGSATANPAGGTIPYTYNWNNGQTTQTATGLCAGTYTVTVTDGTGSTTATTVTITQPTSLIATSTSTTDSCGNNNGTATVNASGGTPVYTYSWNSSGGTDAIVTGLAAGNYTIVIIDGNGCGATQTVTVASSGIITVSQSASICFGYTYTLPGGTVASTGGIYIDTLTSPSGCDSIITTTLSIQPNPMAGVFSNPAASGQVVTIVQGQSVTLTATGGGTYNWSNGTTDSSITVILSATTLYCVTVTNVNNCTDTDCVTVIVESIDCSTAGELFVPNAFSPNGDEENDKLQIYYGNLKCIKTFKFVLYNRWGEKVFETTNPVMQWDGIPQGGRKTGNTAVFVYYMKSALISGEEISKKGNISLIR